MRSQLYKILATISKIAGEESGEGAAESSYSRIPIRVEPTESVDW